MFLRTDYGSSVGVLTLVSDGAGLSGVYFENHKAGGPPKDARDASDKIIDMARAQLGQYFTGARTHFDLPLSLHGTPFQKEVWALLAKIGFGDTRSYGDLARDLGKPSASRAVGAAVGRNPVSIVVPCHRIIGASGALTGYAGAIDRKRFLLDLEGGAPRNLAAPSSPQRLC